MVLQFVHIMDLELIISVASHGLGGPSHWPPSQEVAMFKAKVANTLQKMREKTSTLTVGDLKRMLFRCASTIIVLDQV